MWTVNEATSRYYQNQVDRCLVNDKEFDEFKRRPHYNGIVGMASTWQAEIWYNNIKDNHPNVLAMMESFKKNDEIGSPSDDNMWDSGEYGLISSSTLRYLHTLCDIEKHFGSLDGKTVAEIGVGYGGLCFVMGLYFNLKEYHLVDLDNVILLARKYLSKLNFGTDISFSTPFINHKICDTVCNTQNNTEELRLYDKKEYDLVISEFCISEMDDKGIDDYYEKYLSKSKNIYLLMNMWDEVRKERFINKVEKDFNLEMLKEFPETPEWPNYLMIGKRS